MSPRPHVHQYLPDGYREAARILVEAIVHGTRHTLDTLVYPIVFNYRQYLELRLKEIVLHGRQLSDGLAMRDGTHSLSRSFNQLKEVLADEPDLPPAPDLELVEHVVREFETLDPRSLAFRYATDGDQGARSLSHNIEHINVRHFAEMMEGAAAVLEDISTYISVSPD